MSFIEKEYMTKLCIDCKHSKPSVGMNLYCHAPQNIMIELVRGKSSLVTSNCSVHRELTHVLSYCTIDGNWYEELPQEEKLNRAKINKPKSLFHHLINGIFNLFTVYD